MKRVQRIGFSTADSNIFTGLAREITVDTDIWSLRVHDNTIPGGHIILPLEENNARYAPLSSVIATPVSTTLGGTGTGFANFAALIAAVDAASSKQPGDPMLTAISALVTVADRLMYFTGADVPALTTFTAFARTLLDDVDAAAMRATLGVTALDATLAALAALVTAADQLIYATGVDTFAMTAFSAFGRTLVDDADAATARATIGAQPSDATLTAFAALVTAADRLPYATGVDTFSLATFTAFARTLLDDADAATMRATLGVSAGLAISSQAQAEAGTDDTTAMSPLKVGRHFGVLKAGVKLNGATGAFMGTSLNCTGAVRNAAGDYTVTIATDFSTANSLVSLTALDLSNDGNQWTAKVYAQAAGIISFGVFKGGARNDPDAVYLLIWGDLV